MSAKNEIISEARIQSTCVTRLWNQHPETRGCFFSVTNNSEHVVRGATRKALGLVPGVADCLFFWKGNFYAFEFKTESGKQSPRQEWWEKMFTRQGGKYYVVRSEGDFFKVMDLILSETQ